MELAKVDEQVYQLALYFYQTTFLNFKYEPPFFVYVEIGTSTKMTCATSSTFGFDQRNNLL
jgi:hypothetical protein